MKPFTILAVAPWYGANSVRFLVDAMERIGCRAIRIGPVYDQHLGMPWRKEEVPSVDFILPKESDWHVDSLLDLATARIGAPDLVIISEENYRNTIVNTEKVPSVFYSCDGWPQNYDRAGMVKATKNYPNHPLGIRIHPRTEEDPRWTYLAGACAPWLHKYLGLERDTDFALMASQYGDRLRICRGLGEAGFTVKFGSAKPLGYVKIYNRSLCTLHNPQPGEIKWRFFEAAAMGCINISWYTQLFERLGYKPWIHYYPIHVEEVGDDPWPTTEQMGTAVSEIKNNPRFFKQIADVARKHTIARHTYYHRVVRIFEDLNMEGWAVKAEEKVEEAWKEHLDSYA